MVDVLEVNDYEALESFVPEVMRRLVKVTQVVARARARIAIPPFEVVQEFSDDLKGFDLDLANSQVLHDPVYLLPWDEKLRRTKESTADVHEEVEDDANAEALVDTQELQA